VAANALVVSGDGINCDYETEWALNQAGFKASRMHVSSLLSEPKQLEDFQLCVIPGGFSYGDEIASGKVLGIKLKERLNETLHNFVERGNLLMGICNGFQVLVSIGLLPDSEPDRPRIVSLLRNTEQKFVDRWVQLEVSKDSGNRFFKGLTEIDLPIRHGEGRLALEPSVTQTMAEHDAAHPTTRDRSHEHLVKERAPLRYRLDVNGSFDRIAALTNKAGTVLGLMPHPEAFVRWTQHPHWTTEKAAGKGQVGDPPGLVIFKNALASIKEG